MRTTKIWPIILFKRLLAIPVIILLTTLFTLSFLGCNPDCDDCPTSPAVQGPPPTISAFNVKQGGEVIAKTDSSADITVFRNEELGVLYEIDIPNGYLRSTFVGEQIQATGSSFGSQKVTFQIEYFDVHTGVPLRFTVTDLALKTTSFTINPIIESGINPSDVVEASWEKTNFVNSSGEYVWPLFITADNSLLGHSDNILYKSVNEGNTWEKVVVPESLCEINSMILKPSGDLFAIGTFGDCGFYYKTEIIRSTDNGDSWSILKTNLPGYFGGMQVSKKGSLYLNVSDENSNGISRSTDGITWTSPSKINLDSNDDLWIMGYSIVNDSTMLATTTYGMGGGNYLVRSINYGKTWQIIRDETPWGNLLSASGGKIYANSGGISVSENLGETWQQLNSGIPNDIYINAMTEGADGKIYIAPQDYGVFRLEGDKWKSLGMDLVQYNVTSIISIGDHLYAKTHNSSLYKLKN